MVVNSEKKLILSYREVNIASESSPAAPISTSSPVINKLSDINEILPLSGL